VVDVEQSVLFVSAKV